MMYELTSPAPDWPGWGTEVKGGVMDHILSYDENYTIQFTEAEPGQVGTRNQPELPPVIEIDGILYKDVPVSDFLYSYIMENHEAEFISEILSTLNMRRNNESDY